MTSGQMLKKIGLGKDKSGAEKLKAQMLGHLKEGKSKILLFERKILGGKNRQKVMEGVESSKKKFQEAKLNFENYEKMAERYIEKNPKKAVAMAAAAGVLAGSLWSALKGKKVHPKKKMTSLRAKSAPAKP